MQIHLIIETYLKHKYFLSACTHCLPPTPTWPWNFEGTLKKILKIHQLRISLAVPMGHSQSPRRALRFVGRWHDESPSCAADLWSGYTWLSERAWNTVSEQFLTSLTVPNELIESHLSHYKNDHTKSCQEDPRGRKSVEYDVRSCTDSRGTGWRIGYPFLIAFQNPQVKSRAVAWEGTRSQNMCVLLSAWLGAESCILARSENCSSYLRIFSLEDPLWSLPTLRSFFNSMLFMCGAAPGNCERCFCLKALPRHCATPCPKLPKLHANMNQALKAVNDAPKTAAQTAVRWLWWNPSHGSTTEQNYSPCCRNFSSVVMSHWLPISFDAAQRLQGIINASFDSICSQDPLPKKLKGASSWLIRF